MDLAERVAHLAQVTASLGMKEVRELDKIVEVAKVSLQNKGGASVGAARGRPLLYSYSCDGTPLTTKEYIGAKNDGVKGSAKVAGRRVSV